MWQPDYLAEIERRIKLVKRAREEEKFRAALWIVWKNDPVKFIEDCCITYDPRKKIKLMPFLLFPRQKELVWFLVGCLRDGESGLIEKCRDMGLTWLCVCIAIWLWIFENGTAVGFGSRKQELVDRPGDPDSIFQKIRMQIKYLPDFILPDGFRPRLHSTFMKVINPENSGTVTGEIGDNIGRGGRKQIYFKDESAHYEHPELIEAALGDNTDVQIDISSVNGAGNVFYRRRMAGQVWHADQAMEPGRTRIFVFDWRENPLKSQEWYDRRRKKASDEGLLHIFAQEVDRDYLAALDNIIIPPLWVDAAIDAHLKLNIKEFGGHFAGQDIADGGGDKNALAIRHGVILRHIDGWAGEAGDAPQVGMSTLMEHQVQDLFYDSVGVGTGYKVGHNQLLKQKVWPKKCKVHPWAGGSSVLDPEGHVISDDRESPKNEDHYKNLKAQAWFMLRTRFAKTYKAVVEKQEFDHKDMISLDSKMPKLQQLKMELSQAIHKPSSDGRTMVDKKPDGTLSPNLADACVICYCPIPERSSLFSF